MAKIPHRRRQRTRARKLDLEQMRELLKDRRVHTAYGIVVAPDGPNSHYDLDGVDLLIEVETSPDQLDLTCRWGLGGQGPWTVPAVGDEVVILVPNGQIDFMPVIVGVLSTGVVPEGVAPSVTVISNGTVYVHDGTLAGAESLVKKSEFEAHVHATGVGPSDVPTAPITGTAVLKAK